VLIVRYPGETAEHRIRGTSVHDLMLLRDFSEGALVEIGSDSPSRDHLPRMRELLGIGGSAAQ
jgi:hypothetical protein